MNKSKINFIINKNRLNNNIEEKNFNGLTIQDKI